MIYSSDGRIRTGFQKQDRLYSVFHQVLRAGGYSGLFQLAVISVFASQALAPNGFRDALFWHEPVGDEIPGNMQIILHDQGTRAKRVFVSRRESYDRLIALGAPSDKVKQLGYIYSFVREISTGRTYLYVPIQRMWGI